MKKNKFLKEVINVYEAETILHLLNRERDGVGVLFRK